MYRFNNALAPQRIEALYNALTPQQRIDFADAFVPNKQPVFEDYASRFALVGDTLLNKATNHAVTLNGATASCASFKWNGRKKYIKIPRLVAFLKEGRVLTNSDHVDHINHDPFDHRPGNLRVVSATDNMRYRRTGNLPPGVVAVRRKFGVAIIARASDMVNSRKVTRRTIGVLYPPFDHDTVIAMLKEACDQVEAYHLYLGYGNKSVYLTKSYNSADLAPPLKEIERWQQWSFSTPKQQGSSSKSTRTRTTASRGPFPSP